jgi:hypothetical protein
MIRTFGQLRFLDVNHESLREMTRSANAVYATFDLSPEDISGIAVGDYLMLPEIEAKIGGEWKCSFPNDGRLRIISREKTSIAFSTFVDGNFPILPEPGALELRNGDSVIARGRLGALCSRAAFIIEEVL